MSKKGNIPWNKGKIGLQIAWNKGKHYSKETRKKISIALKKDWKNKKRLGHKQSEETRNKISLSNKGKHKFSEKWIKQQKQRLKKLWLNKDYRKKVLKRRTPSSLEKKFIILCKELNLPYKFVGNGKLWIGKYNPDFININNKKIAIEVYYRRHKEKFRGGIEKWKQDRIKIFNKYNWKLLFFNEIEVNKNNFISKEAFEFLS